MTKVLVKQQPFGVSDLRRLLKDTAQRPKFSNTQLRQFAAEIEQLRREFHRDVQDAAAETERQHEIARSFRAARRTTEKLAAQLEKLATQLEGLPAHCRQVDTMQQRVFYDFRPNLGYPRPGRSSRTAWRPRAHKIARVYANARRQAFRTKPALGISDRGPLARFVANLLLYLTNEKRSPATVARELRKIGRELRRRRTEDAALSLGEERQLNAERATGQVSELWSCILAPRVFLGMSLKQFLALFPDDQACIEALEAGQWPHGTECPMCGETGTSVQLPRRFYWRCRNCRAQFNVLNGTPMAGTHLPARTWFAATFLVATREEGTSAKELSRQLGIGYKTAWYLRQRVDHLLRQDAQHEP